MLTAAAQLHACRTLCCEQAAAGGSKSAGACAARGSLTAVALAYIGEGVVGRRDCGVGRRRRGVRAGADVESKKPADQPPCMHMLYNTQGRTCADSAVAEEVELGLCLVADLQTLQHQLGLLQSLGVFALGSKAAKADGLQLGARWQRVARLGCGRCGGGVAGRGAQWPSLCSCHLPGKALRPVHRGNGVAAQCMSGCPLAGERVSWCQALTDVGGQVDELVLASDGARVQLQEGDVEGKPVPRVVASCNPGQCGRYACAIYKRWLGRGCRCSGGACGVHR